MKPALVEVASSDVLVGSTGPLVGLVPPVCSEVELVPGPTVSSGSSVSSPSESGGSPVWPVAPVIIPDLSPHAPKATTATDTNQS
ncbi:hypothetical protein [Nannocystis pusilla]|uniref:hypothetical protein n=1 Tax=Nannocystis pusilla TaxID=889268 RepID=UPI003DA1E5C4